MRCRGELLLLLIMVLHVWAHVVDAATTLPLNGLVLHYYKVKGTCNYTEQFVKHQVKLAWDADHSITPALLRLVYSDCLVTGCDGSVLLEGNRTERAAPQNRGLRGFDVVQRIKRVLEARCPGVVSCADILHLAAKEAVALAGELKYPVFTGRRDGFQSTVDSVDLPSSTVSWDKALAYFTSKDLDVLDLATLLGAHTTGTTHCRYIRDRLYNFNGTGRPDSSMNTGLLLQLKKLCPRKNLAGQRDPIVLLNPGPGGNYTFNNSYYSRVLSNRAVLGIDQRMMDSVDGRRIAEEFAANFQDFQKYFALAISRMGSLRVLTGRKGEIRRNCSFINAYNPYLN